MWAIPAYVLLGIGVGAGVGIKGGTKEEVAAYATLTGITGYMAAQPGFWSGTAAALNWVRIGAPMATGGGTGIGFGAAAGGTGALTATAGIAAAAVGGAVVGTGISGAIWGEKGASEAAGFYTGGRIGTTPDYKGYADVPGNIAAILRHYVPEMPGSTVTPQKDKTYSRRILGW